MKINVLSPILNCLYVFRVVCCLLQKEEGAELAQRWQDSVTGKKFTVPSNLPWIYVRPIGCKVSSAALKGYIYEAFMLHNFH